MKKYWPAGVNGPYRGADQESTLFEHSSSDSPSGCSAAEWDTCPKYEGSLADVYKIPSHRLQPEGGSCRPAMGHAIRWPDMQISRYLFVAARGIHSLSCRAERSHNIESILDGSFGCNLDLLVPRDISEGCTRYLTTTSEGQQHAWTCQTILADLSYLRARADRY